MKQGQAVLLKSYKQFAHLFLIQIINWTPNCLCLALKMSSLSEFYPSFVAE